MERWLPIVGYVGRYEVSNQGRVRSLISNGLILKQSLAKTGSYPVVNLTYIDGHQKVHKVHHLVLEAFVGPRPLGDIHGRHLNDIPADNRLVNLQWGTRSQNFLDEVRNGHHKNANKTHCKWGHELVPENLKASERGRVCLQCARRRSRIWAANARSKVAA